MSGNPYDRDIIPWPEPKPEPPQETKAPAKRKVHREAPKKEE